MDINHKRTMIVAYFVFGFAGGFVVALVALDAVIPALGMALIVGLGAAAGYAIGRVLINQRRNPG